MLESVVGATQPARMLIAWTTLPSRGEAEIFAREIIDRGLAVCVQIDGPIRSIYRWDKKTEVSEEYRLMIKFLDTQQTALQAHVQARHPYETPEWVLVRTEYVAEKYLSWASAVSTSSTL